jgi:peptidoglycan/LPS O-acetylase OafA/YrhL
VQDGAEPTLDSAAPANRGPAGFAAGAAPREGPQQIASLQSLRGLAALTVCLFHAAGVDDQVPSARLIRRGDLIYPFLNGHGAVVLFFVLSGFVLRLSLGDRSDAAAGPATAGFLWSRLWRLFPVVVATVGVMALVAWLIYRAPYPLEAVARNALLLDASIDPPFWTLQVEVFGSLAVLLAFLIERRAGLWPVVALTLAALGFSFTIPVLRDHLQWGLIYPFLVGYLGAAWRPAWAMRPRLALGVLVVALAGFFVAHALGWVIKQWLLLMTTASSAAMILALASPAFRGALQWRPIALLGALSYSFYALHGMGLTLVDRALPWLHATSASNSLALAGLMAAVAAVGVLLAVPMHYLIERPAMALGRRWWRRLRSPISPLLPASRSTG